MKVYRTAQGVVVSLDGRYSRLDDVSIDELFVDPDAPSLWRHLAASSPDVDPPTDLLPPLGHQEVWAAGVTYFRSMKARMEEAKEAHGSDFYDRVYAAERPELFFKATPQRVVAAGAPIRVRSDSRWTVPEPELTLAIRSDGSIFGYTIGDDVSARDIEGENPLYLPQAKSYRDSCSLGPCLLVSDQPLPASTTITMEIARDEGVVFSGDTALSEMKRTPEELAAWLFRDNLLGEGAYLLTGTGIVPPDSFTLESGDVVRITIPPIGTLENPVA